MTPIMANITLHFVLLITHLYPPPGFKFHEESVCLYCPYVPLQPVELIPNKYGKNGWMDEWMGGWGAHMIIYKVHASEPSLPSSMFWSWSLDLQIGQMQVKQEGKEVNRFLPPSRLWAGDREWHFQSWPCPSALAAGGCAGIQTVFWC